MTEERKDGPTAHGGTYEIARYMDIGRWVLVDKEKATGMIVTEYDKNGGVLWETVVTFA